MAQPPQLRRVTVQEAVDTYLDLARTQADVGQLRFTTVETYARDMHEFLRLAGPATILDDLQGADVDRIILAYGRLPDGRYTQRAKPGRGRGIGTQARFRQSVSRLFSHAEREGWVQANPMERATIRPRVRGERLRESRTALPRGQAVALLTAHDGPDAAENKRADQRLHLRDRALLYLLVSLGPRVSEVCKADRAHLYTAEGIRYWQVFGKGGKVRRLPLPPPVAEAVDAYLDDGRPKVPDSLDKDARRDAERALFLTWRGRRVTPRDIQNMVKRAVDRVPPEHRRDVTPHGLRHTAFTLLIAAGEDVTVVQRLAGHADLSTTGRYRDELPGELERAMTHHPVLSPAQPSVPSSPKASRTDVVQSRPS